MITAIEQMRRPRLRGLQQLGKGHTAEEKDSGQCGFSMDAFNHNTLLLLGEKSVVGISGTAV